jgi:SAM-dependent methyltransferase
VSTSPLLEAVREYYSRRLAAHGPTPAGVDWKSVESQAIRFTQLLRLCDITEPFCLIDYGCGYGALVEYMVEQGYQFSYCGFDIAASMIAAAASRHGHRPNCRFVCDESRLASAEYVVASGILNVRLNMEADAWHRYAMEVVDRIDALSTRGFAFNVLTSYSDPDRMRGDLYYADPCFWFDHCKRRYSRNVALLHDYGLYEFTLLVRK